MSNPRPQKLALKIPTKTTPKPRQNHAKTTPKTTSKINVNFSQSLQGLGKSSESVSFRFHFCYIEN
jgi:hypothetical protein